ncbi:hypothetical protein ACCO45_012776 [Purpureocillium lilacinum]|uniref:Uncharacterized protein n=1 Tax=Purpureocillium lilacinum TaxID=33203 RepID=A0ACC4D9Y4_PURLI
MAGAYKRKRHTDLPTETSPPAKRCKFTRRHRATPFAPSFWDNLSKVSLTSLPCERLTGGTKSGNTCRFLQSPEKWFPRTSLASQDTAGLIFAISEE